MNRREGRTGWVWLGALGWTVVAAVYITATGFRRLAHGAPFYSSPWQVTNGLVMVLVGAGLSPFLFLLFRRLRSWRTGRAGLISLYALTGAAYLAAWSLVLTALMAIGVIRIPAPIAGFLEAWMQTVVMMAFIALGLYAVMVMIFEAVRYLDEARRTEIEAARLQAELAEAQTAALRARVNPDFVYESFDIASRLMEDDVRSARSVLADLSEVLRVSLGRNGDPSIALRAELDLLMRYIDIQRHRFGGALQLNVEVPEGVMSCPVPALILQPVVESLLADIRAVDRVVGVGIAASRRESSLHVEIRAVTGGEPLAGPSARQRSDGIGRARSRLELMYGPHAGIGIDRQEDTTTVTLTFPPMAVAAQDE